MSDADTHAAREARRFFEWIAVGLTVVCSLVVGVSLDWGPAILVLAAASLIGTLVVVWRSIDSLTEDSALDLEEALSLAVPNEEEERKRSVLRALRDLEYERSVGKVNDEDYQRLSQRYRTEAKRLLRRIDEDLGPARKRAEHALQVELHKAGLSDEPPKLEPELTATSAAALKSWEKGESAWAEQNTTVPAPEVTEDGSAPRPTRGCTFCGDRNSLQADVCDSCGKDLAEEGRHLCRSCPERYAQSEPACPMCGVERGTK